MQCGTHPHPYNYDHIIHILVSSNCNSRIWKPQSDLLLRIHYCDCSKSLVGRYILYIFRAPHACDGQLQVEMRISFSNTCSISLWHTTTAFGDQVGQARQSWACSLCTWVWLLCQFAVYLRVACTDITVHIKALLAASSPAWLFLCSMHVHV